MASENAKAVALEVVEKVRAGEKVVMGEIMQKHGYKKNFSKQPTRVTKQKIYKEITGSVIEQLEEERQRALKAMKSKISKAKYRDVVDAVDKTTKNIQLLGGKPTEINQFTIEDVKKRLENL